MSCANHPEVEEGLRPCARCGRDFCGDCTIVVRGRVVCADCKDDEVRDHLSGVGLDSPLADIRLRISAWFIDWLSYYAVAFAFQRLLIPSLAWQAVLGGLYIVYEALMLAWRGQTLGKIALRIKVVRTGGAPLSRGRALLRALIRGIFPSVTAVIDYAPALLTAERTAIHDLVAGTRVVKDSR